MTAFDPTPSPTARGRLVRLLTLLLAMGVTAAPLAAQAMTTAASEQPAVRDGEMRLGLDQAIALALERNLALAVERYELGRAAAGVQDALGIYDLLANASAASSDESSPAASNLVGADVFQQEQRFWSLGVSQLTPLGGTAGIDWTNVRVETNSADAALNPYYSVELDLSYRQPLLRGFGREQTERGLRIARRNRAITEEQFELQVVQTVRDVVDAYWSLVEARAQLEVAEESLALARELLEQNRLRVEVGTLAPLELVQSEAGVAAREEEIIRAGAAVQDAADRVRQLLHLQGEAVWSAELVPTTDPEQAPTSIDLEEALATAMQERPELRSQQLTIQNLDLDRRVLAERRQPQLDLVTSYGLNGLGGNVFNPVTQEVIPGGYDDALDQVTGFDFDGWSVGLEFSYPLQNRSARARAVQADLAVAQGRKALEALEEGVRTEVRIAARGGGATKEQIRSATASVRLAEESLDAERKRFENGMSTSFQVLQVQEELSAARSRQVTAITAYRRALAEFHRATGRLLEENSVQIADAAEETTMEGGEEG